MTSSNDLARLARNLKAARTARGITQPDAAEAVGRTRQTIVNWENPNDTAEPSTPQLAILAELYGVSPTDLRYAAGLARQPARVVDLEESRLLSEQELERAEPISERAEAAKSPRRGKRGKPGAHRKKA